MSNAQQHKQLPFRIVLMDTWYAARDELLFIERLGKLYYCPLKANRQISLSRETGTYCRVDEVLWSRDELRSGRLVHLKDFPAGHQVRLFRLEPATGLTEYTYIVTNLDDYLCQQLKSPSIRMTLA